MARQRLQRHPDKLDLNLSFSIRYGDAPDEQVVFLDEKDIKMVGSVFRYRDKMLRFTSQALVKVAMLQPLLAKRAGQASMQTAKVAGKGAQVSAKVGGGLRGLRKAAKQAAQTAGKRARKGESSDSSD